MKDDKIKSVFDEYLSGLEEYPKVSLDNAKNLIVNKKKQRKQKKKMWLAFASFACALILVISTIFIVDSTRLKYYDIASLTKTPTTYIQLKNDSECSKYVTPFNDYEIAKNANIDYYSYYDSEKLVLLKLDITKITRNGAESATIYIEFTGDKNTAEEFKEYYKLQEKDKLYRNEYKYSTEQVAGEWVNLAYFEFNNAKYFINIESPSSGALKEYLKRIF